MTAPCDGCCRVHRGPRCRPDDKRSVSSPPSGRCAVTEPYPIKVTRWVCGGMGCSRSYSKRDAIDAHMETCWRVPENRACLTCAHFDPGICCDGFECGCRGERDERCEVGIPIPEGPVLHSNCPSWRGDRSITATGQSGHEMDDNGSEGTSA